jgi:tRNA threonylcarbamoyladenosine biosynthesis protein TsaE
MVFKYELNDIQSVAFELSKQIKHQVILFNGQMGAGKTTFIQALLKIRGYEKDASSPTFSLINEYQTLNSTIYHFDLYRIKNLEEALDIGFEEYLDTGHLCLIEWPEKILPLLDHYHVINIEIVDEKTREISFF